MPINAGMMTSNTPEWGTPQWLFDELDAEFHFDLDPCCTHENAKCAKHFTKEEDGLNQEWGGTAFTAIHPTAGRSRSGLRRHTTVSA